MTEVAILLLVASMVLVLMRGLKGPTIFDRILVANAFGTKAMVLIVLIGLLTGNAMFLDIALVYALINFITTVGFLKYFRQNSLGEE